MNKTFLSGKIIQLEKMTSGITFAVLEDEEMQYNIFWEENQFDNLFLENRYVLVECNIRYIKVKLKENEYTKKMVAFKILDMEAINDI